MGYLGRIESQEMTKNKITLPLIFGDKIDGGGYGCIYNLPNYSNLVAKLSKYSIRRADLQEILPGLKKINEWNMSYGTIILDPEKLIQLCLDDPLYSSDIPHSSIQIAILSNTAGRGEELYHTEFNAYRSFIEARTLQYLSNQGYRNIVQFEDFGLVSEDGGMTYKVMTIMDKVSREVSYAGEEPIEVVGYSLHDLIDDLHGSPEKKMKILPYLLGQLYKVASTLDQMNQSNQSLLNSLLSKFKTIDKHRIFHRDVKPGNILINNNGELILGDLGLALWDDDSIDLKISTTTFASPEQLQGIDQINEQSEQYSLALSLARFIAGPFAARVWGIDVPTDVNSSILKAQYVTNLKTSTFVDSLPQLIIEQLEVDLKQAKKISACLIKAGDKDPSKRYKSSAEFISEIHRAIFPTEKLKKVPIPQELFSFH